MNDRELLQMALNALEECYDVQAYPANGETIQDDAIKALRARLAQPPKDLELPLVRPEEFVLLIQGKENFRGIPVMRTEWPTPEPYPENFIDALRFDAALAQPEPEPANWMEECADFWEHYSYITERAQEKYNVEAEMWIKKLRTSPPQREWQGLTDEEQTQVAWSCGAMSADWLEFAEAIEAKLKEKNGV